MSTDGPERCLHLSDCEADNSWSEYTTQFEVRSKTYMKDSRKLPTLDPLLKLVDVDIVDLIQCDTRQTHLAKHPDSYASYLRSKDTESRIVVVVWQLHPRYLILTFVETARVDCEASKLLDMFMHEWDGDVRASRFKLLPYVHNFRIPGVNLSRPCIIAKKITSEFHVIGPNLVEVDINVFSSRVARFILSYVERAASSLVIELAFTLQGLSEEELPERVLGGAKLFKVDLSQTRKSKFVPSSS